MIIKLTKKQKSDLYNCHSGVGVVVVKKSDSTLSMLDFFVNGKNEICIINDNIPSDKVNLNEYVKDLAE